MEIVASFESQFNKKFQFWDKKMKNTVCKFLYRLVQYNSLDICDANTIMKYVSNEELFLNGENLQIRDLKKNIVIELDVFQD
jgi:hypothetical protein